VFGGQKSEGAGQPSLATITRWRERKKSGDGGQQIHQHGAIQTRFGGGVEPIDE
jgi:hypothetical protein